MKKVFFLLWVIILCFAIPSTAFSQENVANNASKWNIGFTAGPQFTNITSVGLPSPTLNGIGYLAGAFTEYQLSQSFKVRLGLNYDRRAFSGNFKSIMIQFNDSVVSLNSYSSYDFNYKFDYVTIPISVIYVKGINKLKLFVQASAYYSLFLTAHQQGYTDVFIAEDDFQYVDQDQYPNIQAGHNLTEFTGTTDKLLNAEKFNTSDYGFNFFIGAIFDFSEKVGIYLSPGFTANFGKVFENPVYDSKWSNIFKVEAGIVYHLN